MLPVTLCSTTIAVWQTGGTACPAELLVKSGCPLAPTDEKMLVCQFWQQGVIKTFPFFFFFSWELQKNALVEGISAGEPEFGKEKIGCCVDPYGSIYPCWYPQSIDTELLDSSSCEPTAPLCWSHLFVPIWQLRSVRRLCGVAPPCPSWPPDPPGATGGAGGRLE